MPEIVVGVLLGVGAAVSLSGALGILRLPDVYLRIQASAKTVIMAAVPVMVGLVVAKGFDTPYASRALLVLVLIVVVNPIASHTLARAAYRSGIRMWPGAVVDQPAARRHPPSEAGDEGGDG